MRIQLSLFLFSDADISLEDAEVRVLEDAERVSVCTELYSPTAKTIAVNVTTQPISATGTCVYMWEEPKLSPSFLPL